MLKLYSLGGLKPTHYSDWWDSDKLTNSSPREVQQINEFHGIVLKKLTDLENSGKFIVTNK